MSWLDSLDYTATLSVHKKLSATGWTAPATGRRIGVIPAAYEPDGLYVAPL